MPPAPAARPRRRSPLDRRGRRPPPARPTHLGPVGQACLGPSAARASPQGRLERPFAFCDVAQSGGDVPGRVGDQDRARPHPDGDSVRWRRDGQLTSAGHRLAAPVVEPLAAGEVDAALGGALLEHRGHPQRRPEQVGVVDRPAARVRGIGQAQRPDDRQPAAGCGGCRGTDVRNQPLVEQQVVAVGAKRLGVVAPRFLLEATVGVHQRREAAELHPAQEQLAGAALHQAAAEVAADVVRPVGVAARRRGERCRHQRAQRPEVRGLIAAPGDPGCLLAGPPRAAEQHAGCRMDVVEHPLHGPSVEVAVLPGGLGAATPVREAGIGRQVVALAVVGLDALDSELQHGSGLATPPAPCRRRSEIDQRAAAHPPAPDPGPTVRSPHEMASPGALGVVGRRSAVEALRPRVAGVLAVSRVEVHPRRHPDHRAHARLAKPVHQALRLGELDRVEEPGVVLALPRRVDDDRVQRQRVLDVAFEILEHLALVSVHVAALPVSVCPFGEQGG